MISKLRNLIKFGKFIPLTENAMPLVGTPQRVLGSSGAVKLKTTKHRFQCSMKRCVAAKTKEINYDCRLREMFH